MGAGFGISGIRGDRFFGRKRLLRRALDESRALNYKSIYVLASRDPLVHSHRRPRDRDRMDVGVTILGLREDRLNVEFTQHTGDEMYHPALGSYSPEWTADEQ